MTSIRAIVIAVITHAGKLWVGEGYDSEKDETYYRPLGGGIDFGESAQAALEREFQEEINAGLKNIQYLTTLENIFTLNGKPGHQIVLVFRADFVDEKFNVMEEMIGDENGEGFVAKWVAVEDFIGGRKILYPEGLVGFVDKNN